MDFLASILKSKWFWIGLAILIIIIIINKNWDAINSRLFERKITNYAKDEEGNVIQISELDKPRLEAMADKIKVVSDSMFGLFSEDLQPSVDLSDQELEYMAKYFKSAYGKSLYAVVDNAWMPHTQTDEQLLTKLDRLALK